MFTSGNRNTEIVRPAVARAAHAATLRRRTKYSFAYNRNVCHLTKSLLFG